MKNTGIIITISFIIGIIIGYYARFYEHAFLYLLFSVIIIVLISAVLFRKYKYTYILVLPVFVIFGFILYMYYSGYKFLEIPALPFSNYSVQTIPKINLWNCLFRPDKTGGIFLFIDRAGNRADNLTRSNRRN